MPLEAIDPEKTQVPAQNLRLLMTSEYAEFDNFREGGRVLFNPGGNRAVINTTSFFLDYGATPRWTVSVLLPYVRKRQETNRFGTRIAEGVGDIAAFGRYELLDSRFGPSLALGLGLKFPTGSIEEPGGDVPRLPPAFQVGSGAYDLIPTISYFQDFRWFSLTASSFLRAPLEANEVGYRFGREVEVHTGVIVPLPLWDRRLDLLASVDFLDAERDEDNAQFLPGRLRDGSRVLNTGGQFVDVSAGLRVQVFPTLALQGRVFVPVVEDWNGRRSANVGQVASDWTAQLSFAYTIPISRTAAP